MESQSQNVNFNINETETTFNFPMNNDSIEEDTYDLKVRKPDSNTMRMRYLSKLSKEQVWLPPLKQPKASQNLVIFDWDDTLFPTTHLNPVDETLYMLLCQKYGKQLSEIEE